MAQAKAKAGEVVLLSPACASGIVSGLQERGDLFKEAVYSSGAGWAADLVNLRRKEADFILLFTAMTLWLLVLSWSLVPKYYILRENKDPTIICRQVQWAVLGLAGMLSLQL